MLQLRRVLKLFGQSVGNFREFRSHDEAVVDDRLTYGERSNTKEEGENERNLVVNRELTIHLREQLDERQRDDDGGGGGSSGEQRQSQRAIE
jgi:hypothetical protein